MDFSLTSLFVVPVGNTLPTSGTIDSLNSGTGLANGQVAVTKDDALTVATTGNVGSAAYIQICQGRPGTFNVGTKRSDKIKASKVKRYFKVVGQATAANQITDVSGLSAKCDETVSLTLRGHSSYVDTISFNGLTRTITAKMPCCDCGEDPCTTVSNETVIDLLLAEYNKMIATDPSMGSLKISDYWTLVKVGTGDDAILRIYGKTLTNYSQSCEVDAFPYEYDRFWFRTWVYKGADTSVDFFVYDNCEQVGTVTVAQRSGFALGTSDEVAQLEKDYYSYQSPMKHLYVKPGYNPFFQSWVTAGTIYDQFLIQFDPLDQDDSYSVTPKMDERVIIFAPTGSVANGIRDILNTYLGTATDETSTVATTTTTTTTTSTTTSTTTTLQP